jgi:hypothetical protein
MITPYRTNDARVLETAKRGINHLLRSGVATKEQLQAEWAALKQNVREMKL